MKLFELLIKIQNNSANIKRKLTGVKDGEDFEKSLIQELTNEGSYHYYSAKDFKKHKNFRVIKKLLLEKSSGAKRIKFDGFKDLILGGDVVIYQPFGSQSFPDIILINSQYVIPFETKFSNKDGDRPTWNSNLPHDEGIYIFGSRMKSDISFFNGMDLLPTDIKEKLVELVVQKSEELYKEGLKITTEFSLYLREMYNQKSSVLKSKNRKLYEDNVIELLKELEE